MRGGMQASGVVPLLLEACPSYRDRRKALSAADDFDPELLYVHLGDFAGHVVDMLQGPDERGLVALAGVIERLLSSGDAYVREAVTIGLLEGIQNHAGDRQVSTEALERLLGAEASRWWQSLKRFWGGEIPYVGADLTEG